MRSTNPETSGSVADVRAWSQHYGTSVAGLTLIASLGVAGLGALRMARGESNSGATLLAGLVGLTVGALMLRAKPALRASVAAVICAVGFALLSTETFLAWQAFNPSNQPDIPDFDSRSVLEVVRDLEAGGTPAVPALLSSYVRASRSELVPLTGIANATTVFCNEAGQYVIYRSDEHGFNNPRDMANDVEFVVLGDSFAHGQCVPQGQDVAGLLRAGGNAALNLGNAGSGPLGALGALLEYGLAARPETILWLYYEGNDPLDLEAELRSPTLARYLEGTPHQDLRERQEDVDQYWRAYLSRIPDPGHRAVVNPKELARSILTLRRIRRLFALTNTFPSATPESLRRVLTVAQSKAKEINAELVFVYLPAGARVEGREFVDHRPEILDVAAQLDLRTVDFSATVSSHPDPKSLYPNQGRGHFDEDGYRLLAETIQSCLARESGIDDPCH